MNKLFLFKAIGAYFGGVAGAVAATEQKAFKRIKQSQESQKQKLIFGASSEPIKFDYPLYSQRQAEQCYHKDEDYLEWKDSCKSGFTLLGVFELKNQRDNTVFCEIHEG